MRLNDLEIDFTFAIIQTCRKRTETEWCATDNAAADMARRRVFINPKDVDFSCLMRKYTDENPAPRRIKRGRAVLVGYGLDEGDGHIRYTRSNAVELFGGSDQAHDEMQKRAIMIQDELSRLGISLDGMTYEQFEVVKGIVDRVNCE